jgi:cytochrome P450
LSFGFGLHYCLGFGLARLETRIAIEAFLKRFEAPNLITDDPPSYYATFFVRNLLHFPARLEGRASDLTP